MSYFFRYKGVPSRTAGLSRTRSKSKSKSKLKSKPKSTRRIRSRSRSRLSKTQALKAFGSLQRNVPPYLVRNLESLQFGNPRGSVTRGWKFLAPKRGTARHSLKSKCGSKAFLLPAHEGFPVMSLHSHGCAYSCPGLHAAYSRARQYGHHAIAARAHALIQKHC